MKKIIDVTFYVLQSGIVSTNPPPKSMLEGTFVGKKEIDIPEQRVAYIDISRSIGSPKQIQKSLNKAMELGFNEVYFFGNNVSKRMYVITSFVPDAKILHGLYNECGCGSELRWINKLPEEVIPVLISDGQIAPADINAPRKVEWVLVPW